MDGETRLSALTEHLNTKGGAVTFEEYPAQVNTHSAIIYAKAFCSLISISVLSKIFIMIIRTPWILMIGGNTHDIVHASYFSREAHILSYVDAGGDVIEFIRDKNHRYLVEVNGNCHVKDATVAITNGRKKRLEIDGKPCGRSGVSNFTSKVKEDDAGRVFKWIENGIRVSYMHHFFL